MGGGGEDVGEVLCVCVGGGVYDNLSASANVTTAQPQSYDSQNIMLYT